MIDKKQAFRLISDICNLNENQWSNHAGSYDDAKQSALQIEEALEGLKDLPYLATRLHPEQESHEENFTPRECSRQIVKLAMMDNRKPMLDVDRFDKHLDSIYLNIGSLHMLGLSPEQMIDGLQAIHNKNKEKSGVKDSEGKVQKPANFVGPEPELQIILDKRTM